MVNQPEGGPSWQLPRWHFAERQAHQVRSVARPKLILAVFAMHLDRARAQPQLTRDFFRGVTGNDHVENLPLARRQHGRI
jgi:hypothetical protein